MHMRQAVRHRLRMSCRKACCLGDAGREVALNSTCTCFRHANKSGLTAQMRTRCEEKC